MPVAFTLQTAKWVNSSFKGSLTSSAQKGRKCTLNKGTLRRSSFLPHAFVHKNIKSVITN